MIISCTLQQVILLYAARHCYLPCLPVLYEERNILSCTSQHDILAHNPCRRERVPANFLALRPSF